MLVASAYAADRITRKVFFNTLDLFVRHAQRQSDHPEGIKPEHLTQLGISLADAHRLPLCDSKHDLVLVAGLLSGVIDMVDIDLLYGSGPKGRFLQRHFPGFPILPPAPPLSDHFYRTNAGLLIEEPSHNPEDWKKVISLACARMEKGPDFYTSTVHFKLRLLAAQFSGVPLNILGPFDNRGSMEQAFADIFHVVDPHYEPGRTGRKDLKNFHFVEPKRIAWIPREPKTAEPGTERPKSARSCSAHVCNVV